VIKVHKVWMVLVAVASLVMAGCMTTGKTHSGIGATLGDAPHGGGVAYFANGEKLTIGENGGFSGRCQLCQSPENDLGSCKAEAAAKQIAVCPEMLNFSAPRGTLMCPVIAGPHAGSFVPFGTTGYTCYRTGSTSCVCIG